MKLQTAHLLSIVFFSRTYFEIDEGAETAWVFIMTSINTPLHSCAALFCLLNRRSPCALQGWDSWDAEGAAQESEAGHAPGTTNNQKQTDRGSFGGSNGELNVSADPLNFLQQDEANPENRFFQDHYKVNYYFAFPLEVVNRLT
jgi:hypothetical protein